MILADTSVWVDHFRSRDRNLVALLEKCSILGHPFVLGEIACGNLRNRDEVVTILRQLPQAKTAADDEALLMIDHHDLMGRGIGYIDAHLLASVSLTAEAFLWTHDKRLAALAEELDLAWVP